MKLMQLPQVEYREQRRLAAEMKGMKDKWSPPARNEVISDGVKLYFQLGEVLVEQGWNPIQAIRAVFEQSMIMGLRIPEPKQVAYPKISRDWYVKEAMTKTLAQIGSSIAKASRNDVEAELLFAVPTVVNPSQFGGDFDPVLALRMKEAGGFPISKQDKLRAIRQFNYCPQAYRRRCPGDIPECLQGKKTFEDLINGRSVC